MSTYKARKNAAQRFGITSNKLLSTTALVAAAMLPGAANAKNVGDYDVFILENTDPTALEQGYSEYTSNGILIDNLVQEDIGRLGHTHLNAPMSVLTGIEAGPMHILGKLTSTGEVKLLDVSGFLFGSNSVVDTQGFAAIGGTIENATSFLTDGSLNIDVSEDASIIIEEGAMISVGEAGLAAFVAPHISNSGIINAKMGTVALVAGETVTLDLYGDGLVEIAVEGELADALIENKGTIAAEGGRVQMTALAAKDTVDNLINVDGVVTVASATQVGGKIVLSGGSAGKVSVSGELDATGTTGGDIEITGEYVVAENDAVLDASGINGGGTIHFGGEYKGGGDTPTSKYAYVGQNAILRANAEEEGDGGDVIVWSDETTVFNGTIEAKGGAVSGDGGFVETSGKEGLISRGSVDASATNGAAGEWLLDPRNISIDEVAPNTEVTIVAGDPTTITASSGSNSNVDVDTIEDALDGGTSVTIRTANDGGSGDGDINVNSEINKDAGGDATLRLEAHDDINVNESIIATVGALTVELIAEAFGGFGGNNQVNVDSAITTNGGDVLANGEDINVSADITTGGGSITLTAENSNVDIESGGDLFSGGGEININAANRFSAHSNATIDSTGSAGDVNIVADVFDLDGNIDAGDATVTIQRDSDGDISLGDNNGGMHISQSELERIDAGALTVGGNNTSEIDVEDVNTTTATISGLVTLNTGLNTGGGDDVNFFGTNVFNALEVNSDDDITFAANASVETLTGGATFNGDENDGSVGNFDMGEDSSVDTNGNDITVNALDVNLGEDALLDSEGGDINIDASDAFGDGNVTLASGALIDADGGNIVIDNDAIFFSEDDDSVTTNGTGTIDINQNEGGSIQNAVDAVNNTGSGKNTIHVGAGTYEENIIVIDDNMYLKGANSGIDPNVGPRGPESIIDGGVGLNGEAFAVKNVGDNFMIDGFTLTADGYGVDVGAEDGSVENVTVKNNIISTLNVIDIEDQGVRGINVVGGWVTNNLFTGVGNDGILFTNGENINITDNVLSMIDFNGIELDGVNGSVISRNTIDSTGIGFGNTEGHGILVKDGAGVNHILANMIGTNDGAGNIAGDGIQVANTDGIKVAGNTVANALGNGIYNNGSDSTTIQGNTITDVALAGVLVNPSFDVDVFSNVISGALQGVKLENSSDITVSTNTIFDVVDGVHVTNAGGTLNMTGNGITANNNGIHFADAVDGGVRVEIISNTVNAVVDGVHFNADTHNASVRVNNNNITGGDDGVEFADITGDAFAVLTSNAIAGTTGDGVKFGDLTTSEGVLVGINTSITGGDNGVEFGAIDTATVGIQGNGLIQGGNNGILFNGNVSNTPASIVVADNTVTGLAGDGIQFGGTVENSRVDITGDATSVTVSNAGGFTNIVTFGLSGGNTITGAQNGIEFNGVSGNSNVGITSNALIQGLGNNGIDFGAGSPSVSGGSTVEITGNASISGAVDGIHFADQIDNATVRINDNESIVGVADDGVDFNGSLVNGAVVEINSNDNIEGQGNNGIEFATIRSGSSVEITENNDGIHADDNGIFFNLIDGGSTINVHDNIIKANLGNGTFGAGILFFGDVSDAEINVGDGTLGGTPSNIITVGDNLTATPGVSDLDGIRFNKTVGADADILIDGNRIGYSDNTTKDPVADDAIEFRGAVSGNANIEITDNRMAAADDGVQFSGTVGDMANVVIGETPSDADGNIIDAGDNGISFLDEVSGEALIEIADNTIDAETDGIVFKKKTSNAKTTGGTSGHEIYIRDNSVTGGKNGISFEGRAAGENHDIKIKDNTLIKGEDGHGVTHTGGINAAHLKINSNDDIQGTKDGVHVFGQFKNDGRVDVRNNAKIFGDDDGVHIKDNTAGGSIVRITGNTDVSAGEDGIRGQNLDGVLVEDNDVHDTGRDGVYLSNSDDADIFGNTFNNIGRHGTHVNPSDNVEIVGNEYNDIASHGIFVDGGTGHNIRENTIRRAGWDGITVRNFGNAWVAYNDIKWTGDDGIHAENGDFVSIYNNYIDLSGFMPNTVLALGPFPANEEVGDDANGIYVEEVGGAELPEISSEEGFGYSLYGANVEIYGNDVANSEDDGIQVERYDDELLAVAIVPPSEPEYSAYIANNLVGHVQDDGIDVDDIDYVVARDNIITLAEDAGITIRDGKYAGVFDNRVLLTGTDGIRVHDVYGGEEVTLLGDENYGYGWSVNVSGNEVAFTGEDGIHVGDSGPTKIQGNNVFAAGLGEDLEDVIEFVNDLANGTFNPIFTLSSAPSTESILEGFSWEWGDGHGISVHNVEGAYYSPNGWAVDVRGNNVAWTGGHGILVENSDRTRIKNNDVEYAGIDEIYFGGTTSMASLLSEGPFDGEGRRDLWRSEGHGMVEVLESYIGEPTDEPEDPEYGDYITIGYVDFDSHDGIHAENIYGRYAEGLSGNNYLYDLKIKGNNVRKTGDDGIEVVYAGRTLIAENTVRHAGYGDDEGGEGEYYGSGDYYGADGIHARYVTTDIEGYGPSLISGGSEDSEGYNYEPAENYALIIRNNDVRNTADDGIEVVGSGEVEGGKFTVSGIGEGPGYYGGYYSGTTDRVLIAENTVRRSGYFDNEFDIPEPGFEHGYENVGPDGYGHDGIHVRNVTGTHFEIGNPKLGPGNAGGGDYGFYGYAVDIINNDVRKTGDDGIEVFNSESTLILGNTVRKAGVYRDNEGESYYGGYGLNTDGADYYGADGIHVRNVGGANPFFPNDGYSGPEGFEPYSVAIVGNDVRDTADDGIEVVGENGYYGNPEFNERIADWDDDAYQYNGTGRTIILGNTVRDAGVSGYYGGSYSNSYDSRDGYYSYESNYYGNRGSYDGYGGDGIHVRGVGNFFNGFPATQQAQAGASGGPSFGGDYIVKVIDNDVRRTGDDGIEVIGNSFGGDPKFAVSGIGDGPYPPYYGGGYRVLVADNFVKKAGLSAGHYSYKNSDYQGYDESGNYYYGYSYNDNYSYYGNPGQDGYGADGIHVRNVGNFNFKFGAAPASVAGDSEAGFYGYAVDILGNTVRKTADDGIEVRNSESTLIAYNDVKNAGKLTHGYSAYHSEYENGYGYYGYEYSNSWGGYEHWYGGRAGGEGNYTGGDGIHVENVGGRFIGFPGFAGEAGDGFSPYSVVVYDNNVKNSADDGIEVLRSGRTRIEGNDVKNSGLSYFEGYGYYSNGYDGYYSYSRDHEREYYHGARASDGRGADGIHVGGVNINEIDPWIGDNVATAGYYGGGFNPYGRYDSVEILGNTVDNSADDGIQVEDSGDTLIADNTVTNSGTGESYYEEDGYYGGGSAILAVTENGYYGSYYGGYYYYGGVGEIDATGGDGINVSIDRIRGKRRPGGPRDLVSLQGFGDDGYYGSTTNIRIIGNTVDESADDGIEVIGKLNDDERRRDVRILDEGYYGYYGHVTNVLVERNDVDNSGDNGIALITTNPFGGIFDDEEGPEQEVSFYSPYYGGSIMNSELIDNEVRNSGNNGLHVEGYNHNDVILSGNTFIDNPTGARFESGHVDLTGATNSFIVNPGFDPEGFDFVTGMQFELAGAVSDPTSLTIVDETLGTTSFSGFINRPVGEAFYVRFEDGAILDSEGEVIVIDGTDASWDGVVPSTTGDVLPPAVLAAIEDRLFDADDPALNGRGQIFVGNPGLLTIDNVEDFFNRFGPFGAGISGLNLTVTGLPPINLPQGGVAGIEPFAGGEGEDVAGIEPAAGGEDDGESVADIEPAAGDSSAACWNQILEAAVDGPVNYSFSGEAGETLTDTAAEGCS